MAAPHSSILCSGQARLARLPSLYAELMILCARIGFNP
jgi:hypothetical protein